MSDLRILIVLSAAFLAVAVIGCGPEAKPREDKLELIYQNSFAIPDDLKDWVLEGPGTADVLNGRLILTPTAQSAIYDEWERNERRPLNAPDQYYGTVRRTLEQVNPDSIGTIVNDEGKVVGGHIVCWNRVVQTPGDYVVEYTFKSLSPIGLGIVFFSAQGVNGADVLSAAVKPRHGVFRSYTHSDINCYHISYWANNAAAGPRYTCNLRKNSGFYHLASGPDPSCANLDYADETFTFLPHRIKVRKKGEIIQFFIDGEQVIKYRDNRFSDILTADGSLLRGQEDTGPMLLGGRIGLRQMVGLKAEYTDFRVYRIIP